MIYHGNASNHKVLIDNEVLLPLYNEIINHSPDGFSWGYNGSGPSQLAFAILYNYTNDLELSKKYYIDFRTDIISKFNMKENFSLDTDSIEYWLYHHKGNNDITT